MDSRPVDPAGAASTRRERRRFDPPRCSARGPGVDAGEIVDDDGDPQVGLQVVVLLGLGEVVPADFDRVGLVGEPEPTGTTCEAPVASAVARRASRWLLRYSSSLSVNTVIAGVEQTLGSCPPRRLRREPALFGVSRRADSRCGLAASAAPLVSIAEAADAASRAVVGPPREPIGEAADALRRGTPRRARESVAEATHARRRRRARHALYAFTEPARSRGERPRRGGWGVVVGGHVAVRSFLGDPPGRRIRAVGRSAFDRGGSRRGRQCVVLCIDARVGLHST